MHPRHTVLTHSLLAAVHILIPRFSVELRLEEVRKQSAWGPLHLDRHEPMDLCPVAQHPGHHIGLGCRNRYKPRSQIGRNIRMTDVVPKRLHHLCASPEVGGSLPSAFPCPAQGLVCSPCVRQFVHPNALTSFTVEPGKA